MRDGKNELPEIVERIRTSSAPLGMTTKVIAIDGLGGAGKSTLATKLAQELGNVTIVHTDDFASWDNPLSWWPRLIDQVLKPLSKNKLARYQRYDWESQRMADWYEVEPGEYLVVEGVSSSREAFRPYLAFSVWVETPREERLRRGLERDGQEAQDLWDKWMAEEDVYVERENPAEHASLVISGQRKLP